MRIKVGRSGNRRHYRTNTVNMNELMHIVLSLQLMFGSRRAAGAVLAILLFCGVGYLAYNYFSDSSRALRKADEMWNRDQHVDAVREYKSLLMQRDPLDTQYALLPGPERPRLIRRIISHEVRFASRAEARDWISMAYGEGINFEKADFENDEVFKLWQEVTADYKDPEDARNKERNFMDEFLDKR